MPKKRPYEQFCPITTALDRIGDRWTLPILRELFVGPMRYGELHNALAPISTDVLAGRLRELEGEGLLHRRSHNDGYDLTEAGRETAPVLRALGAWGAKHMGPPSNDEPLTADRIMQMVAIAGASDASEVAQTIEVRSDGATYSITRNLSGTTVRRASAIDPQATVTTDGATLWQLGAGAVVWDEAVVSAALEVEGDVGVAQSLVVLAHPIPVT